MRTVSRSALAVALFVAPLCAGAWLMNPKPPKEAPWTNRVPCQSLEAQACRGPFKGGRTPTQDELTKIFANHQKWLKLSRPERKAHENLRANLCDANLSKKTLGKFNQPPTFLDLKEANLLGANLSGAHLLQVNLTGAELECANLQGADLFAVNFRGAFLMNADMASVHFGNMMMQGTYPSSSLAGAEMFDANLSGVNLQGMDFSNARLVGVRLDHTILADVKLAGAGLPDADLANARIGVLKSLPPVGFLQFARNLSTVTFLKSEPEGLIALRNEFRKKGLIIQQREVTYAIMRTRQNRAGPLKRVFSYIFFNQTCRYGMDPGRCLCWFAWFFLSFTPLYFLAQFLSWRNGGIWADWPKSLESERLTVGFPASDFPRTRVGKLSRKLFSRVGLAVYFSALSALRIGWREFNLGEWLERMQPRDYRLRASGWVKFASGLQSLISVYLLALWFLTYFGNPFG